MALTPTVPRTADSNRVTSAWGNEIRDRTLQVFASIAERDAQWTSPPNGAECVTLDTNTIYRRVAGAWVPLLNYAAGGAQSGDVNFASAQSKDCATLALATWPVASVIAVQWTGFCGFGGAAVQFTPYTSIAGIGTPTFTGKALEAPAGKWVAFAVVYQGTVAAAGGPVTLYGSATSNGAGFVNGNLTYQRVAV